MAEAAKKIAPKEPDQKAKEFTTAQARDKFADLIERVFFGKERLTIVRRGKKAAALIPLEDLALLEQFEEEEDRQDIKAAEAVMKRMEETGEKGIPLAEVMAELGLK